MLALTGLLGAGLVAVSPTAQAVHDGVFELDAGAAGANTSVEDTTNKVDWERLFRGPEDVRSTTTLPSGFLARGGGADYALPDRTTFATGSKDTLPISTGWQCTSSNNVGDKVDIVNSYATAYVDGNGDLILYYGAEKSSPNGSSNIAVWFLKDGTVNCSSTGGAKNFTGQHTDGDILLVSAFESGGSTANVNAYEWEGNGATGALSTTPIARGKLCGASGAGDGACSVVNKEPLTTPWNSPDKNGGALDANEFFEGGVNVGPAGVDNCFATVLANTRSSASLTATLFDFQRFSLPVCGDLAVSKYIDANLSGTQNAGDVTSGMAVTGWAFSVAGPAPSSTVVCSGTTNSAGSLVCATGSLTGLAPGNYTITETQQTGFFNTDAASGTAPPEVNRNTSVSSVVAVGVAGATFAFGNTCYVAKTFEVTGVPTGAAAPTSVTVSYQVNGDAAQTLALAPKAGDPTTWLATVSNSFLQTDSITWSWYTNGDSTNSVAGRTGVSLADGAYPACAKKTTVSFPSATLNGLKYKDGFTVNGTQDGPLNGFPAEPGLGGFVFDLKRGTTVIDTATSSSTAGTFLGTYSFANVPPGSYTVCERAQTGWAQTEPTNNACRAVTVTLGETSKSIGSFGNTPLVNIGATVTHLTGSTTSTITCRNAAGDLLGSGLNSASATNLRVGTYTCVLEVVDP